MACVSQEGRRALKVRMILFSAWKRRTKARDGTWKTIQRPWKKTRTQAGPVWHLTSQWSGRFRAAHFSAAHRRVGWQSKWSKSEEPYFEACSDCGLSLAPAEKNLKCEQQAVRPTATADRRAADLWRRRLFRLYRRPARPCYLSRLIRSAFTDSL